MCVFISVYTCIYSYISLCVYIYIYIYIYIYCVCVFIGYFGRIINLMQIVLYKNYGFIFISDNHPPPKKKLRLQKSFFVHLRH